MSISASRYNWPESAETGIVRRQMSLSDYLALLDSPEAEGHKIEWVDGTALIMPPPTLRHGEVQLKIGAILMRDLSGVHVGVENGVKSDHSRRGADVLVFVDYPIGDNRFVDSEALIVVEVLSPSTWREDLGPKAAEYASIDVPYYWTADDETSSMTLRRNTGNGWQVDAILDESNPEVDVEIGSYGTVKLRLSEIFGDDR